MLIAVCSLFLFFALKISKEIDEQIELSKNDPEYLAINESRKKAMSDVWLLLIWLLVVAIESFTYSVLTLSFYDDHCVPRHLSLLWYDIFTMIDRMTNYQSWFLPLIWLYWPTMSHKQQRRSRRKAIEKLNGQNGSGGGQIGDINGSTANSTEVNIHQEKGDSSDDDYSDVETTSNIDYKESTERAQSMRDQILDSPHEVVADYNRTGFAQNANIFIVG